MRLVSAPRPGRAALTAATAIVIIALGAGPAAATWTVTPGGKFTGTAGTTRLKDTTNRTTLACAQSSISGTLKAGSGLNGTGVGAIASGRITNCSFLLPVTVTLRDLPWHVNVTSYHDGVVHGTISRIDITVSLPASTFTIDGTAAGAIGIARITYTDSAHTLKLFPAGGACTSPASAAARLWSTTGTPAAYLASYTITPPQVITSP